MDLIKTKDSKFLRDTSSNVIIGTDEELERFKQLRKQKKSEKSLQEQINNLKIEFANVKLELQQLKKEIELSKNG